MQGVQIETAQKGQGPWKVSKKHSNPPRRGRGHESTSPSTIRGMTVIGDRRPLVLTDEVHMETVQDEQVGQRGKYYTFFVDGREFQVSEPTITGRRSCRLRRFPLEVGLQH